MSIAKWNCPGREHASSGTLCKAKVVLAVKQSCFAAIVTAIVF